MRTFLTTVCVALIAAPVLAHSMDQPAPPRPDLIPFMVDAMPGLAEQQSEACSFMIDETVQGEGLNCIIVGTRTDLRNLGDGAPHVLIIVGDGAQDIMEKFGIWSDETLAEIAD